MNLADLAPLHAKTLEPARPTWLDSRLQESRRHPSTRTPALSRRGEWRTFIAARPEHFAAAEELLSRRYAWRGYRSSGDQPSNAFRPHSSRTMLLAESAGTLTGTLTIRDDSALGLLAERTYGDEIRSLRSEDRRLGELGKLAVEEGVDWKTTLDALVQSAYIVARIMYKLTDVVIEVNPRHVRFYQRVFGFTVGGAERMCERVGAPSVLLHLDVDCFGRRLQLAA